MHYFTVEIFTFLPAYHAGRGWRWPPLRWPGVANEPLANEGVPPQSYFRLLRLD